jgi:hypothetical protein
MNAKEFRKLALGLPEVSEEAHQGHPDFRVRGKIFATLGPEEDWAMVKLTPQEQAALVREQPEVYQPFKGAWGRRGCTRVELEPARKSTVRTILVASWRHTAPEQLVREYDERA